MMWKNRYRLSRRPSSGGWSGMPRWNQQMDHLYGGTRGPIRHEYPLLQAWTSDDGLIILANIPGADKDALDITVDGRTLTLSGSLAADDLADGARQYRQERASGEFQRSVQLPFDVDFGAVKAGYTNGVLEIELPRLPEEKPRKITVNGN